MLISRHAVVVPDMGEEGSVTQGEGTEMFGIGTYQEPVHQGDVDHGPGYLPRQAKRLPPPPLVLIYNVILIIIIN